MLWQWRNSSSYRQFCSWRKEEISFNEFCEELEGDFQNDRHEQYMICKKSNFKTIGTIFSYNFNPVDGHAFVTTFISSKHERRGYGAEAFILFVTHLFETYNLHKVYTEVYEYNSMSLQAMLNGGLIEEGRFKEHRLHNERRWDLIRLACYARDLPRARKLLFRLGAEEERE